VTRKLFGVFVRFFVRRFNTLEETNLDGFRSFDAYRCLP
jgi:hypothetical protein